MDIDQKFKNPTPVAVAIIPVEKTVTYKINGLDISITIHEAVYCRRNIEPKLGLLALPGGFVNEMERLETGGKREVLEETGLTISEDEFQLFRSEITPNNRNLIFGITPTQTPDILITLEKNLLSNKTIQEETQAFVIGGLNIEDAAFPLHQKALGAYFDKINGAAIQKLLKNSLIVLTDDDLRVLLTTMKADGHLTHDYPIVHNVNNLKLPKFRK